MLCMTTPLCVPGHRGSKGYRGCLHVMSSATIDRYELCKGGTKRVRYPGWPDAISSWHSDWHCASGCLFIPSNRHEIGTTRWIAYLCHPCARGGKSKGASGMLCVCYEDRSSRNIVYCAALIGSCP
eukprot:scaffold8018_cov24-Tisochrysis_lutea.AAC.1